MTGTLEVRPLSAKIGKKWFEFRSFSPIPAVILVAILPAERTVYGFESGFWILMILAAECLRLWAVGYAGSVTRTRGSEVTQLVHAGPFQFVRNLLYIANVVMYTSAIFLFGHVMLAILFLLYFFLEYHFIVAFEESILLSTFGNDYQEFAKEVPRWIPRTTPFRKSRHSFQLKKALRSERTSLILITLVLLIWFGSKLI